MSWLLQMTWYWTWGYRHLVKIQIFISFGYISRSGIAGLYGGSVFKFLKNLHTVLHSGCTNLHYTPPSGHQTSLISLSLPKLVISCPFDHSHSNRYEVISHCDFVCISLMIINVVYLLMQLLVIWMSSLEKCLLRSFAHFLVALLAFCYWVEKKLRRYFDLEKTLNGNINVKRLRTASFSFLLKSTSAKYSFWWTNK